MSYRFRVDEGKLVLQVFELPKYSPYYSDREGTWRDATVADIPVTDPFRREQSETYCGPVCAEQFP